MAWDKATQGKYIRSDDHRQNNLTDAEWEFIGPMFPEPYRRGRPRTTDLRRVFDAIQFMLASGG